MPRRTPRSTSPTPASVSCRHSGAVAGAQVVVPSDTRNGQAAAGGERRELWGGLERSAEVRLGHQPHRLRRKRNMPGRPAEPRPSAVGSRFSGCALGYISRLAAGDFRSPARRRRRRGCRRRSPRRRDAAGVAIPSSAAIERVQRTRHGAGRRSPGIGAWTGEGPPGSRPAGRRRRDQRARQLTKRRRHGWHRRVGAARSVRLGHTRLPATPAVAPHERGPAGGLQRGGAVDAQGDDAVAARLAVLDAGRGGSADRQGPLPGRRVGWWTSSQLFAPRSASPGAASRRAGRSARTHPRRARSAGAWSSALLRRAWRCRRDAARSAARPRSRALRGGHRAELGAGARWRGRRERGSGGGCRPRRVR